MRVVGFAEFLTLPIGTIYAKYAPAYTEEFGIKGDSLEGDFIHQTLDPIDNMERSGGSSDSCMMLVAMESDSSVSEPLAFNVMGRDGCFDDDQLFVVFERQDHERLIERLQQALAGQEPD